ncbi:MAG TPA: hypothetical protein VK158_05575 [Acidobacteriota bacterium]|nr:hypothetical protein [Acidobacteriota bacterium]
MHFQRETIILLNNGQQATATISTKNVKGTECWVINLRLPMIRSIPSSLDRSEEFILLGTAVDKLGNNVTRFVELLKMQLTHLQLTQSLDINRELWDKQLMPDLKRRAELFRKLAA